MKTVFKRIAIISAILLSGAVSATPMFVNGGFTNGASGWTLRGGCGPAAYSAAGNGSGAVFLNSCGESNSDPTASQTLTGLFVGQTYLLSWDQRLLHNYSGGGRGKSFGVFLGPNGGNPLVANEFLSTTWRSMSASFVATNSTQLFTFAAELDQRTTGVTLRTDVSYALDNVSLRAVPEPASLALMGLGLLGLSLRRRKQK